MHSTRICRGWKEYKLIEVSTRKHFIERSFQFEEDELFDTPPSEAQKGITTLPIPFDDDYLLHFLDSYEEDQDQHDHGIEFESHQILDPNPTSIPNRKPNPRWDQKLIATAGDGAGNPEDRSRTRSQYQNEHVALSLTYSLPTKWCKNIPGWCYWMIMNY